MSMFLFSGSVSTGVFDMLTWDLIAEIDFPLYIYFHFSSDKNAIIGHSTDIHHENREEILEL